MRIEFVRVIKGSKIQLRIILKEAMLREFTGSPVVRTHALIPKGLDSVLVWRPKNPQTSGHGQKDKEDVILKTRE